MRQIVKLFAVAVITFSLQGCVDLTNIVRLDSDTSGSIEQIWDWEPGGLANSRIYPPMQGETEESESVSEKAFLDHCQRLIRVAEAAMVMRVSATSVSCS